MNLTMLFFMIFTPVSILIAKSEKKPACQLSIIQEWKNLDTSERDKTFNARWILTTKFVFKRRDKEFIALDEIDLAWHGPMVKNLVGSLYKKEPDRDFIPLDESLVCDGRWIESKQILQLRFNHKEYLQPTTTFCLVLTVPNGLEKVLKAGYFDLIPDTLPHQLKVTAEKENLRISMLASNTRNSRRNRLTQNIA